MKIFSGNANKELSEKICEHLNIEISDAKISKFADGEINIIINDNVRKEDCYIIQPTGPSLNASPNDNFMELLILIDALKRGSANTVNVLMPYYGYQRQDRKDYSRAPISAKVIASCLEALNIDRVMVFDLHAGQIQGFFSNNIPFDNLYIEKEFINYINLHIIKSNNLNDFIIISPDEGGMKRSVRISNKIGVLNGAIYKERTEPNKIKTMTILGNVENKNCILVDDIIDTAGTACNAAEILKKKGAKKIYMLVCHGIFSKDAIYKIKNSHFERVITTNTLCQLRKEKIIKELNCDNKFDIIDISWYASQAIKKSHLGESIIELYDNQDKNYYLK